MFYREKKKLGVIIPLIISFICILSLIGYYYFENNKVYTPTVQKIIKENNSNTKNKKDSNNNVPTETVEVYQNNLPAYRQQYNNKYIMGKLSMPGVKLESIITRANNNQYYLNHNLYNTYDELGNPFFDYRNTNLANARQINIYGHNTQNSNYYKQLPFTNLEAYNDYNVFKNNKDVTLEIDEKRINYKVVAVKIVTSDNNEHTKLIFYSDQDFINHINKMLSNSVYKENISVTAADKYLVLQACHYNPRNSYLLVIAKQN